MAGLLRQHWSPCQIAGRLKRSHSHDESRRVSHETIYKTLFIQARGALQKELVAHLQRSRHDASFTASPRKRRHTRSDQR